MDTSTIEDMITLCDGNISKSIAAGDVKAVRAFAKKHKHLSLKPQTVQALCGFCLFSQSQINEPSNENAIAIIGEGKKMGLCAAKIARIKNVLTTLLFQLPTEYFDLAFKDLKGAGGGFVFVNLCNNYEGNLWTGMQAIMDDLLILGQAAGRVKNLTKSDISDCMPNYYIILKKPASVKTVPLSTLL